jgi:hypothetical protein
LLDNLILIKTLLLAISTHLQSPPNVVDGYLAGSEFGFACVVIGQPGEGFFEVGEGPDVPAVESADKGKFADALMRIQAVKDGETLLASEASIVKGFDKGRKFIAGEERFGGDREGSNIQDGVVNAAFAAGVGQNMEGFSAGLEIKVFVRIEADEFAGADDLDFEWHRFTGGGV